MTVRLMTRCILCLLMAFGLCIVSSGVADASSRLAVSSTRSVVRLHGEYLTTYRWSNGTSAKILDLRGGRIAREVTSSLATSSDAVVAKEAALELTPDSSLTAANKVASLSIPIANTSDASMVQGLGAPASVVAEFARQDAFDGITSTTSPSDSPMATTAALSTTTSSTGPIYNRTCYGSQFDGNQAGYYGCWNQYLAYRSGADWYLADHFYVSAYMHDTAIFNPDELTGLQQGAYYGSGNAMINWQPKSTSSGGNCSTSSVTIGAFGQSYTDTFTKCPGVYGLHSISQTSFYTKWDGQNNGPNNGSRNTGGVDEVHSPPSASPSRGTSVHYWYA